MKQQLFYFFFFFLFFCSNNLVFINRRMDGIPIHFYTNISAATTGVTYQVSGGAILQKSNLLKFVLR